MDGACWVQRGYVALVCWIPEFRQLVSALELGASTRGSRLSSAALDRCALVAAVVAVSAVLAVAVVAMSTALQGHCYQHQRRVCDSIYIYIYTYR